MQSTTPCTHGLHISLAQCSSRLGGDICHKICRIPSTMRQVNGHCEGVWRMNLCRVRVKLARCHISYNSTGTWLLVAVIVEFFTMRWRLRMYIPHWEILWQWHTSRVIGGRNYIVSEHMGAHYGHLECLQKCGIRTGEPNKIRPRKKET